MEFFWLNRQDNKELILFFNGWGMDQHPVQHIECSSYDVLEFHDYSSQELSLDLPELVKTYDSVSLIAWSLGVWAAAEFLSGRKMNISRGIAINGTTEPVSIKYGISPNVFQGTIDNWSDTARGSFNRRMCKDKNILDFFTDNYPDRSAVSQKEELVSLQSRIESSNIEPSFFDTAVIGIKDKIFPSDSQQAFWKKHSVYAQLVPAPHYFFNDIIDWRVILGL